VLGNLGQRKALHHIKAAFLPPIADVIFAPRSTNNKYRQTTDSQMPPIDDFSTKVKSLRTELKLSQEDLAKALGVSFATVNRWENARTQPSKLAQKQLEMFITLQQQQGALKND
jgi:DNA-binding transcriptional regulator YiaG